jgi:hypothetical protein
MTAQHRELLRPEDATSFQEFQARRVVEQAQIRALNSSWKGIGRIILSGVIAFGAILFWGGMAFAKGDGKWILLVLALVCTVLFIRIFGRIELRGARGSKRYMQLNRLSKEWQAKASRGEIPATTPDGPKVWRDELSEARPQET